MDITTGFEPVIPRSNRGESTKLILGRYSATIKTMNTITIPKEKIEKAGGLVILPVEEYEKLRENVIPTYYLQGKEAKELDKLVEKGLKDHKKGKTITAGSLGEALKIYGKKNKRD